MRTTVCSLGALVALVAACSGKVAPSNSGEERAGADTPASSQSRTFDPRRYGTTCSTKSDCAIVPFVSDCNRCCGSAAVRADEAAADLRAVEDACRAGSSSCSMECAPTHAECVDQRCIACGELSCKSGVMVRVAVTEPGDWVFELTVDGSPTSCTLSLPGMIPGPSWSSCQSGAELLPVPSTNPSTLVLDVLFPTTTAKTATFRVTRDGTAHGEKTIEPSYVSVPGPNGPECEPRECILAKASFP